MQSFDLFYHLNSMLDTILAKRLLCCQVAKSRAAHRGGGGGGGGGETGAFFPGPQPERGPRRPHEGHPEYLFKRSIYSNRAVNILIEQSQYSSEEQCSKLIDKEMWLVMGSYCHCQQVVTFFFFGLQLTTWVKGPTLTLCPGPLNFSGRPWLKALASKIAKMVVVSDMNEQALPVNSYYRGCCKLQLLYS